MVGIVDVARAAGVSNSTASRALTGNGYVSAAARHRVLQAAQAIGYVPAPDAVSLVTGRTGILGVLVPYATRWFFAEAMEGVQGALLEHGLDLILYDAKPGTEGRRRIFERALPRRRYDALIAIGLEPDDREMERLLSLGRPVVSIIGDHAQTSVVAIDDESAVRRAIGHLAGLGHRDILMLGGGARGEWAHVDHRRLDHYTSAMTDLGLAERVRHVPSPVTIPGGFAIAADLLADPHRRPTAILGVCDEVAIGCIVAARAHGLDVPRELSIVGIDDHDYADMFSLTTIEQIPRDQGAAAVQLALRHMEDPTTPPQRVLLQGKLILRASTTGPLRLS